MHRLDLQAKLAILADAAKYDASCASSGSVRRDSRGGQGVGSTDQGMGICHAYAPDGRCISLLKILLTNSCIFDCAYCINRKSSNVRRARFTAEEVVRLGLVDLQGEFALAVELHVLDRQHPAELLALRVDQRDYVGAHAALLLVNL